MPKVGRLSTADRLWILENREKLTVADMAARLDRTEDTINKVLVSEYVPEPEEDPEGAALAEIRKELRSSEQWRRLRAELSSEELRYFEEGYLKLMGQFQNDVLPSEETQIFSVVKLEVLMSRNLIERRKALDAVTELEADIKRFASLHPDKQRLKQGERAYIADLHARLKAAQDTEGSRTADYVKLQAEHNKLMASLKAVRSQRIDRIESGRDTILGIIKKLQAAEAQRLASREMGLMKLAGEKERLRLGAQHTYEDGSIDRPILSADTVDLE